MAKFELTTLKASDLQELDGYKTKMEGLVKDNPFIEITDNESYQTAKKRRTALKSGRTEIQNQDKTIGSFISQFRKKTMAIAKDIIGIVEPHEEKQQAEIDKWELKLEEQRNAKALEDESRKQGIKDQIEKLAEVLNGIIDNMTVETVDASKEEFAMVLAGNEFNYMEFDDVLELRVDDIRERLHKAAGELVEVEEQRQVFEKQSQENEMLKRVRAAENLIDMADPGNNHELHEKIDELMLDDYDFGEFNDKYGELYDEITAKAADRIKRIQDNEVTEERNRIINVREGLLDRIYQMTIDDEQEVADEVKTALAQPITVLMVKDEFDKMVERVKTAFNEKAETLKIVRTNIHARTKRRIKQIEKLGFVEVGPDDDINYQITGEITYSIKTEDVVHQTPDAWKNNIDQYKANLKASRDAEKRNERLAPEKELMIQTLEEMELMFGVKIKLKNPETKNLWMKFDSDFSDLVKASIEHINEL